MLRFVFATQQTVCSQPSDQSTPRYFEVLEYNGGGALGMEMDGILDRGMMPMHRSDARIVNVSKKELETYPAWVLLINCSSNLANIPPTNFFSLHLFPVHFTCIVSQDSLTDEKTFLHPTYDAFFSTTQPLYVSHIRIASGLHLQVTIDFFILPYFFGMYQWLTVISQFLHQT